MSRGGKGARPSHDERKASRQAPRHIHIHDLVPRPLSRFYESSRISQMSIFRVESILTPATLHHAADYG
jgi:hypothetical protein